MRIKTLLGERIMILPDNSDEIKSTGGIIIPESVKAGNNHLKSGVIVKKGAGVPWNLMDDVHVKERICYRKGAGTPYEEEVDGRMVKYLILSYAEILLT